MKNKKNVTLLDVAKHAGVSRATASLAVRGSNNISEVTRAKVFNSMQELGYVYDRIAANLRSKSSSTVGLIFMELANPFYSELLVGIHQELDKFGQTVILGTTFDSFSTQDRLLSTMLEYRVGGIILSAVSGSHPETIERVTRLGIPIVLVGRKVSGIECDYVGVNNVAGGQMAVEHLLRRGHRKIAFLGGLAKYSSWLERKRGYSNALQQAGIEIDPSLIMEGPATRENGIELAHHMLSISKPPTAIFCYNDVIAIGVMIKMKEMGLTPGRDIAVVGFDNIPEAAIVTPKLTTVSSFIRIMGKHVAALLQARINNPDREPQNISIHPELIIRESCSYTAGQI